MSMGIFRLPSCVTAPQTTPATCLRAARPRCAWRGISFGGYSKSAGNGPIVESATIFFGTCRQPKRSAYEWIEAMAHAAAASTAQRYHKRRSRLNTRSPPDHNC